ncbi:developmental regulator VosA [Gaeumannomyces tritici R3-111a-1]|uniref:Developmental regulator VosA n=1 Tax=Gaeumannomyces tritici (strain R3-111a-1) TaxID=644352 RepID=J3P0D5_GAET3|nr:developmental regulator VosA [Gaeumannomyces tritici R3-111a-1]EJT77068.1 developmental regulator VosA [Gaeumannomyces tritici R3-111a-1]
MTLEANYPIPTSYPAQPSYSMPTTEALSGRSLMMGTAFDPQLAETPVEEPENGYTLHIRQHPKHARVALGKEKDRKPIDPPPIVQLRRSTRKDPHQHFLHSPYYFMTCRLIAADDQSEEPSSKSLLGTLVSSLHRLRDSDNHDGGFFVFGDLSVREEGTFRLMFSLFDLNRAEYDNVATAITAPFTVHPAKSFPGMTESTFLTRSFSDQGVRLRLRKDSRTMTTRKRNHQHAEVARKHSDWDKQQHDPSRQNSIIEGQITPTERTMGSFPSAGGYYEQQSSHRGHYDNYPPDPSYYGSEGTVKRMRYSMPSNDVSQSPTYLGTHDMGHGFVSGRSPFSNEASGEPPRKVMRPSLSGSGSDANPSPTFLSSRHPAITGGEVTQSPTTYMTPRQTGIPGSEVPQSAGYQSTAYLSPQDLGHSYGAAAASRPGFSPDAGVAPTSLPPPLPTTTTTTATATGSASVAHDLTPTFASARAPYQTDPVSVSLPLPNTTTASTMPPLTMSHAYQAHPSYPPHPHRINTQLGSQEVKSWW